MSKIGSNDFCWCGSRKKYKNCHWPTPEPTDNPDDNEEPALSFQNLIEKYNPDPIIKLLGVLQLIPANHGFEAVFENLSRMALLERKINDKRPFAPWNLQLQVFEAMSNKPDSITNNFTENIVFSEGNYVVYGGIYYGVADTINKLLECFFLQKNNLPPKFLKAVQDGGRLLLKMSALIANDKEHKRFMFETAGENIRIPQYETVHKDLESITFEKEYLKILCTRIKADYAILQKFILPYGFAELSNEDPDENPVSVKPLIETEDSIIVYMPTTIPNALREFIFHNANEHNCTPEVFELLHAKQFEETCLVLEKIGWKDLQISLPKINKNLLIRERIFQFDDQKLGYLCFVDSQSESTLALTKRDAIDARNKRITEKLMAINKNQPCEILLLTIVAETGVAGLFSWKSISADNQSLVLTFSELQTITYSENTDSLMLWKFSKTYSHTAKKVKLVPLEGILGVYAAYENNNGSLLHSDRANPIGGVLIFDSAGANELYRKVQKDRDEHAVLVFDGKRIGYTKVIRPKKYAPVYKDKFHLEEHRLVIENFKMPIWVSNYQAGKSIGSSWDEAMCEAIAYWLQRMEKVLKPIFEKIILVQMEIEVVLDSKLLTGTEYEKKDVRLKDINIDIKIDAPKIKLHVPFNFLYLARQPENIADKVLVNAALNGIRQYAEEAKNNIELTEDDIEHFVEDTLQPNFARMLLFRDPTSNVRTDSRNLPTMRYLQETDISYVLDNLVGYLSPTYTIPENISEKEQKIKICDDIVWVLYSVIESKIKVFNGEMIIEKLVRLHERCVQQKELNEILIPARLASYSSFDEQVKELGDKGDNLVSTSHAVRILIEFVATNIPDGIKWANNDDIDEILALLSQVIAWGTASESIRFGLSNPAMGLLPSGRIGIEKILEKTVMQPYSEARAVNDVYTLIEGFDKNYLPEEVIETSESTTDETALDNAFRQEFGITLSILTKIVVCLIKKGFDDGNSCVKIEQGLLYDFVKASVPEVDIDEIVKTINLLTLLGRPEFGKPPYGYKPSDTFAWHFTRPLSYLRRPLVKRDFKDETVFYYGFRHLQMYIENLYFLLYNGKLPEKKSPAMATWIAGTLFKKGRPFREKVKEWFKSNSDFTVVDYEVDIKPNGHLVAAKDYGDIDVLMFNHKAKIVYCVECKNIIAARNIHEMKIEMDLYLGREGQETKANMYKHAERDKWLKANKAQLIKFNIDNPDEFQIKSFILTADEIPLPFLKNDGLALPIKSFVSLRQKGILLLEDA